MGSFPEFKSQRFYRGERLKSKKSIERLFGEGERKLFFPLLLYHLEYHPGDLPYHQVLFTVPRKNFKRAVDRNKIRRRIREAFRRHKSEAYNNYSGLPFLLGYVYISKSISTYAEIERSVVTSLRYLIQKKQS